MAGTTIRVDAGRAAGTSENRLQELGKFFEAGFRLPSPPPLLAAMGALSRKNEHGGRIVGEVCAAAEFVERSGLVSEPITTLRAEGLMRFLRGDSAYPGFFFSTLKAVGHPRLGGGIDETLLQALLDANTTIVNSTWNGTRERAETAFLAMLENAGCGAEWITVGSAFGVANVAANLRAKDDAVTDTRMDAFLAILRNGSFDPSMLRNLAGISAQPDPVGGLKRFS